MKWKKQNSMKYAESVYNLFTLWNSHTVLTNGETTDLKLEAYKHPLITGAARQISGSSSIRTSGHNKQLKRRKNNQITTTTTTQQPFDDFEDENNEGDDDRYPHGVLVHEPHPIPPFDPSFDPSFRVIGGVRVPGIDDSIYGSQKHGERGDADDSWKTWERFGTKSDHTGHESSMHSGSDHMLMSNHRAGMVDDDIDREDGIDEQPCTLGCLNSEFLCSRSCQCVPKFTRCNAVLDCDFEEDEENCGGKFHTILITVFFSILIRWFLVFFFIFLVFLLFLTRHFEGEKNWKMFEE